MDIYDLQGKKEEIKELETEIRGLLQDLISAKADDDLVRRGDTLKGTLKTLNIQVTWIVGEKERKEQERKEKEKERERKEEEKERERERKKKKKE